MIWQQQLSDFSVKPTSKVAFEQLVEQGITGTQMLNVLKYIRRKQPCSRRQISKGLSMETSTVSARVNSLITCNYVEVSKVDVCPISKRKVEFLVEKC